MPTFRQFASLLFLVFALFLGSSAPTFVRTTGGNSTNIVDSSSGSSAGEAAVEFPPFDAMEYYLATNKQLLRLSGKRWLGSMACPVTKEKVYISVVDFAGCAFGALQVITLDVVLPIVGDTLSTVSGGVLDAPIKFAEEAVQGALTEFETCVRSLGGKEPNCDSTHTLKSCASVATTVLGSGLAKAAVKRLVESQADTATSAIAKLKMLTATVETECKKGCDKGDCARETLVYQTPKCCECAERFVLFPNYSEFSPASCALNMRFYDGARTEEDWKRAINVDPGENGAPCTLVATWTRTRQTVRVRTNHFRCQGSSLCPVSTSLAKHGSCRLPRECKEYLPLTPSPTFDNAGDSTSSALRRRLWLLGFFAALFAIHPLEG